MAALAEWEWGAWRWEVPGEWAAVVMVEVEMRLARSMNTFADWFVKAIRPWKHAAARVIPARPFLMALLRVMVRLVEPAVRARIKFAMALVSRRVLPVHPIPYRVVRADSSPTYLPKKSSRPLRFHPRMRAFKSIRPDTFTLHTPIAFHR